MSVHPFPLNPPGLRGTIHCNGDRVSGYYVMHESSSGNSYGSFLDFADADEAITAAYALNRDTYHSACEVFIAAGVIDDANPGCGLVDLPSGDF